MLQKFQQFCQQEREMLLRKSHMNMNEETPGQCWAFSEPVTSRSTCHIVEEYVKA